MVWWLIGALFRATRDLLGVVLVRCSSIYRMLSFVLDVPCRSYGPLIHWWPSCAPVMFGVSLCPELGPSSVGVLFG